MINKINLQFIFAVFLIVVFFMVIYTLIWGITGLVNYLKFRKRIKDNIRKLKTGEQEIFTDEIYYRAYLFARIHAYENYNYVRKKIKFYIDKHKMTEEEALATIKNRVEELKTELTKPIGNIPEIIEFQKSLIKFGINPEYTMNMYLLIINLGAYYYFMQLKGWDVMPKSDLSFGLRLLDLSRMLGLMEELIRIKKYSPVVFKKLEDVIKIVIEDTIIKKIKEENLSYWKKLYDEVFEDTTLEYIYAL